MWSIDEAINGQKLRNNFNYDKQPLNIEEVFLVLLLNMHEFIPRMAGSLSLQCLDFLAENLIYSSYILFRKYHFALIRKKWNDPGYFLYYQPAITPAAKMLEYKNAMLHGYQNDIMPLPQGLRDRHFFQTKRYMCFDPRP